LFHPAQAVGAAMRPEQRTAMVKAILAVRRMKHDPFVALRAA
jgi:hypothetical protein